MARPEKEIKASDVLKLAVLGCTNREIAAFCECSTDTIERRFAAELEKGREQMKTRLRQMQWKAAEKGNVVMLIWLGKQILGQKDKAEIESTERIIQINIDKEDERL